MQLSDIQIGDWFCDPEILPYNNKYHYNLFKVKRVTKKYILFHEYFFTDILHDIYSLIHRDYVFDSKRLTQNNTALNRYVKIREEEAKSILVRQVFDGYAFSIIYQEEYSDF